MTGHFPVVKIFIAIPFPGCIFRNMERSSKSLVAKERVAFRIFRCEETKVWLASQLPALKGFLPTKNFAICISFGAKRRTYLEEIGTYFAPSDSFVKRFPPHIANWPWGIPRQGLNVQGHRVSVPALERLFFYGLSISELRLGRPAGREHEHGFYKS